MTSEQDLSKILSDLLKNCAAHTEVCGSGLVGKEMPSVGQREQRRKISKIRIEINTVKSKNSGTNIKNQERT